MSTEQLKKAMQAIAFCADDTWCQQQSLYQEANLNLYLAARRAEKFIAPRTVRDSIPDSKLAKYGNYEYNEARELSYAPVEADDYESLYCKTDEQTATEPWMLKSVDELFMAYVGLDKLPKTCNNGSQKKYQEMFYPRFTKKTNNNT